MISTLIIEDDLRVRQRLRTLFARHASIHVMGEATTLLAGAAALGRNDYDLVLLSIQLPGGNGLDLLPFVRPSARVVFLTVPDERFVRIFRVNSAEYIVKPISATRLSEVLRRVTRASKEDAPALRRFSSTDSIFLRGAAAGGRFVAVELIVAILSSENYSEVLLADGERWFIRRTMRAWVESLPSTIFVRVRRTAIVNLHCIERIERDADENTALMLRGVREPLAVGRRVWPQIKARLNQLRSP